MTSCNICLAIFIKEIENSCFVRTQPEANLCKPEPIKFSNSFKHFLVLASGCASRSAIIRFFIGLLTISSVETKESNPCLYQLKAKPAATHLQASTLNWPIQLALDT